MHKVEKERDKEPNRTPHPQTIPPFHPMPPYTPCPKKGKSLSDLQLRIEPLSIPIYDTIQYAPPKMPSRMAMVINPAPTLSFVVIRESKPGRVWSDLVPAPGSPLLVPVLL